MTKEIIIETNNEKNRHMSALDKIIIIWFFANLLNLMVLSFKRTIKK